MGQSTLPETRKNTHIKSIDNTKEKPFLEVHSTAWIHNNNYD